MDEKPSIKIKKSRVKNGQSAFEFITTYGWAILILAVVITLLYYFIGIPSTSVPSKCQFLFGSNCQGIIATSMASSTKMTMIITNAQNYPIFNPLIKVATDSYGNLSAACVPANALVNPGSEIICNVTIPQKISPGTTITGTIYLNITACPSGNIKNCQPEQLQTYKGNIITRVTSQSSDIHLTSTSTSSTSTSSTSTSSTSTSSTSTTTSTSTSTSTIGCSISTVSYSTPGGPYLVTVPTGCSSATVTLAGGAGGGGGGTFIYPSSAKGYCGALSAAGGPGGSGASLSGSISITPGESLYVWVGGGGGDARTLNPTNTIPYSAMGTNGINGGGEGGSGYAYEPLLPTPPEYPYGVWCSGGSGGGGGGFSAIGTSSSTSNIIAIAAGGAGGGGGNINGGGAAGGSSGANGNNGFSYRTCTGAGGGGATTSAGGSAGPGLGGSSGSAYSGGQGAQGGCVSGISSTTTAGGGGGGSGGYYGGGGGGSANAGGGGGSSYWSSAFIETSYNSISNPGGGGGVASVTTSGSTVPVANNGMVTITWS